MNLYLVERTDAIDWDNYKGMVVAASSEDEARQLHPCLLSGHGNDQRQHIQISREDFFVDERGSHWGWVSVDNVSTLRVTLIGTAIHTEATVVLADYEAG